MHPINDCVVSKLCQGLLAIIEFIGFISATWLQILRQFTAEIWDNLGHLELQLEVYFVFIPSFMIQLRAAAKFK